MPDGASRIDLRNRKARFQRYAIENALRWYEFANGHLEKEIPNGSLILVTGCDMTSAWGLASFSDVPENVEVELSFSPSSGDGRPLSRTFSWETNVPVTVRTSLQYESISALNHRALSGQDQPAAEAVRGLHPLITSASQNVDARHGTVNTVGRNQIYNITNHITVSHISDSGML